MNPEISPGAQTKKGRQPIRFQQALDWLKAKLSDGAGHAYRDLEQLATSEGISLAQLPRVKVKLGVKSYKRGRQWFWTCGEIPLPSLTSKQESWLLRRGIDYDTDEEGARIYAERMREEKNAEDDEREEYRRQLEEWREGREEGEEVERGCAVIAEA